MLGQIAYNVLWWAVMYLLACISFAAGFYVLYRQPRSAIGLRFDDIGDDCNNIDTALGNSVAESFAYLVRVTLEGFEGWQCLQQSSAHVPGLVLHVSFLVIVVICLLNVRRGQGSNLELR
jgi:ABC-type uncharacterized transport system permease subunit